MRTYKKSFFCIFTIITVITINCNAINIHCENDNTGQCVKFNNDIYFFSVSKVLQIIEYENNKTLYIVKGITIIFNPTSFPIIETGEHGIHLYHYYTTHGIINKYFIMGLLIEHIPFDINNN